MSMFANAQGFLVRHLKSATGLPVGTVMPSTRPDRFVRVVRTGGYRPNKVTDTARITFECWNTVKADAERDAQSVRVAVHGLAGRKLDGVKVHRVDEIAAPVDSPDPDTSMPRYVLTLEVHFRGTHRKAT